MRFAGIAIVIGLVGCAADPAEPPAEPTTPQPIDVVWGQTIRAGDLIVLVPGTGSYQFLAAPIEALGGTDPIVDVRDNPTVAGDAIVFEQAIAAVHRAGLSNDVLTSGSITLGLWGAGFTKLDAFEYVSYEGIQIHIVIFGGENSCATGSIFGNLFKYNTQDAQTDATAVYTSIQTWLAANPSTSGSARNVIVASHSWGGAVSEYLGLSIAAIEAANGPLTDGAGIAPMKLTVAAGVPGFILGMSLVGPGLRDLSEGKLYEIDRPDDPVHAMNPSGNGGGHQYSIVIGDDFLGSYGVTTTELACDGVAGECM
jgi:hypothetical protein